MDFFVQFFFEYGIRLVIFAVNDFDGEKQFFGGGGEQGEVRADGCVMENLDFGAGWQEGGGGQAIDAAGHFAMEALANLFMPFPRSGAGQSGAFKNFFVRGGHGDLAKH